MSEPRTSTDTLIKAMTILARQIKSDDGVANAAIAEASIRLKEQRDRIASLEGELEAIKSTARENG